MMAFVTVAMILCGLFGLAVGLTVGYATGSDTQRERDDAELDLLRSQVDAFDHARHLGKVFTPPANLREAVGQIVVEDVQPGSWFDLFNRADTACELCDGLGKVPCPCTREAR